MSAGRQCSVARSAYYDLGCGSPAASAYLNMLVVEADVASSDGDSRGVMVATGVRPLLPLLTMGLVVRVLLLRDSLNVLCSLLGLPRRVESVADASLP